MVALRAMRAVPRLNGEEGDGGRVEFRVAVESPNQQYELPRFSKIEFTCDTASDLIRIYAAGSGCDHRDHTPHQVHAPCDLLRGSDAHDGGGRTSRTHGHGRHARLRNDHYRSRAGVKSEMSRRFGYRMAKGHRALVVSDD